MQLTIAACLHPALLTAHRDATLLCIAAVTSQCRGIFISTVLLVDKQVSPSPLLLFWPADHIPFA